MVIVQIVVLDAVSSLDSVITAVGMVKHLSVMMIAVVIAVGHYAVGIESLDGIRQQTSDRGDFVSRLLDDDRFLFRL